MLMTMVHAQGFFKADERLNQCFSCDYITGLEKNQPELIAYYNYFLDNSYYVVDLKKAEKRVDGIDIHTVTTKQEMWPVNGYFNEKQYKREKFNIMKYNFEFSLNNFKTYVWKEADVAIVIVPLSHISAGFKNHMKELNK